MAFSAQRALMVFKKIIYERGYLFNGRSEAGHTHNKTGWNFVTETSFDPANGEMSGVATRDQHVSAMNGENAGYPCGGRTSGFVIQNEITKMIWSTEVDSILSAVLTHTYWGMSGVAAWIEKKGYNFGGETGGNEQDDINGLNFVTETALSVSTLIQDTLRKLGVGCMSSTKGYHIGGVNGSTEQDDISAMIFATETANNPSATLSFGRDQMGGFSSLTRGYVGGTFGSNRSADSFLFSTETNTNLGVTFLAIGQEDAEGIASISRGYWCAGTTLGELSNIMRDVQAVNFSNDTFNNPSNEVQAPGTILATSGAQWRQI